MSENFINLAIEYSQPSYWKNFDENDVKLENEKSLYSIIGSKYLDERSKSNNMFDNWFDLVYSNGPQQVEDFVDGVFNSEHIFNNFHRVKAVTFIMSWETSDHKALINRLVKRISTNRKSLAISRVSSKLTKRAEIKEKLHKVRKAKNLLIIVDHATDLETNILRTLVVEAYNSIEKDVKVAILFCSCDNSSPIQRRLSASIRTTIEFHPTIFNEFNILTINPLDQILQLHGSHFMLGHRVMRFIEQDFLYNDPTITNLSKIYQYCMYQFFNDPLSMFTLKSKDVLKLLKTHPEYILDLKSLHSISHLEGQVAWNDNKKLVNFCEESFQILKTNHKKIMIELNYYYDLLRDSHGNFPEKLIDIYTELMTSDSLAQSEPFMNAIHGLKDYTVEGLIKRLERAIAKNVEYETEKNTNLREIFKYQKLKFENNQDLTMVQKSSMITKFIEAVKLHARTLKNPLDLPLSELYYFDNVKLVQKRLFSCPRSGQYAIPHEEAITSMTTYHNYYFKILYNLVLRNTHEICEADLYTEFCESVTHYRRLKNNNPSAPVTPSKRSRNQVPDDNEYEKDEGFIKALYIELIDDMENCGILKRKLTRARSGFLERRIWHHIQEQ